MSATLEVKPATVSGGGAVTVSWAITNSSGNAITKADSELTVNVAPTADPLVSGAVVLRDISQDIAAGATVKGSFSADVFGAEIGSQKVFIWVGSRVAGGVTDVQVLGEAPLTITG